MTLVWGACLEERVWLRRPLGQHLSQRVEEILPQRPVQLNKFSMTKVGKANGGMAAARAKACRDLLAHTPKRMNARPRRLRLKQRGGANQSRVDGVFVHISGIGLNEGEAVFRVFAHQPIDKIADPGTFFIFHRQGHAQQGAGFGVHCRFA